MTVREFDGIDDLIDFSIGAVSFAFGTIWALVWTDNGALTQRIVTIRDGSTLRMDLRLNASGLPSMIGAAALTALVASKWYFVGVTKATGTVAPRFHLRNITDGGAWVHENSASTLADASTSATNVRLGASGGGATFFNGKLGGVGILNANALSDGAFELLGQHYKQWLGLAGVDMIVRLDQAVAAGVTDLSGNGSNQSGITGTTALTEDQPLPYGIAQLDNYRRRGVA